MMNGGDPATRTGPGPHRQNDSASDVADTLESISSHCRRLSLLLSRKSSGHGTFARG